MKTIGLVLSSVPGYSETFFTSKISGLSKNGFKVILFAKGKKASGLPAHQVRPFPMLHQRWAMVVMVPFVLGWTFLRSSRRFLRLWKLEKAAGFSLREIIERVYISAHILSFKLDWLHFGFITQAVKRENVALAMRAKMGVSLRGYDICIYPLTHPNSLVSIWPRVDKLHVLSIDLLQAAYRHGCPPSVPVVQITPSIDVGRFVKQKEDPDLKESPLRLLTVGRLHWKKGLEYAFEACALLKEKDIPFQYTVVGEGIEKEKLVFLADQLGISENVIFAGKLKQQDVMAIMHESHVYLQPSIQEGFCNAVLEAQAAGLLCVVSDAEGLRENVLDGVTGWVVPKRDSTGLAEKIMMARSLDREKRQEIKRHAVERVKEKFNIANHWKEWVEFYK